MSELHEIRLDPTLCDAHGFCVELLPELFTLDEWGYPLLNSGTLTTAVPHQLLGAAKKAVVACPVAALRLERLQQ
ncbi:MAG: ferredoxin [Candidatus Nanopelagicales bacterium]|nr:ferredoxin [Candidatus Nanopelagicales bacterium]